MFEALLVMRVFMFYQGVADAFVCGRKLETRSRRLSLPVKAARGNPKSAKTLRDRVFYASNLTGSTAWSIARSAHSKDRVKKNAGSADDRINTIYRNGLSF
jgi:hypothetical protein